MPLISIQDAALELGYRASSSLRRLIDLGRLNTHLRDLPDGRRMLELDGLAVAVARATRVGVSTPEPIRLAARGVSPPPRLAVAPPQVVAAETEDLETDEFWDDVAQHLSEHGNIRLNGAAAEMLFYLFEEAIAEHAPAMLPFTVVNRLRQREETGDDIAQCAYCGRVAIPDLMTEEELDDLEQFTRDHQADSAE